MVFATIINHNPNIGMFNATQTIEILLGFQYPNYYRLITIIMTMYVALTILKTKV
jgi:hypothetical protein